MLINSKGYEQFSGKSRSEINHIAGGKTPGGQEARQAKLLAPLHEVHILSYNKQKGFTLGERAKLVA